MVVDKKQSYCAQFYLWVPVETEVLEIAQYLRRDMNNWKCTDVSNGKKKFMTVTNWPSITSR